ncbi:hypothetical protein EBB07_29065 [Paenibacillaceae bacterium]|nr:hypothetical protein EBB07_29065 [Paenibacillaceae bacterium]
MYKYKLKTKMYNTLTGKSATIENRYSIVHVDGEIKCYTLETVEGSYLYNISEQVLNMYYKKEGS